MSHLSYGAEARYAKALFDIAVQNNCLDVVWKNLRIIKSIMQDEDIVFFIKNPIYTGAQKFKALNSFFDKYKFETLSLNYVALMLKNRRGELVAPSIGWFERYARTHTNVMSVHVYTPIPLTEKQKNEILVFAQKYKKGVQDIAVKEYIDKSLIAGLAIRVDSDLFDFSVKAKLNSLKNSLTS